MIDHLTYLQEDVVELAEAISEKAIATSAQPDVSFILQVAALHMADASRAMTAARLSLILASSAHEARAAETNAAAANPHAKP